MPFLGTHLQVRPVDGFSRMMAQTTRTRIRMCLCLIWSHGFPYRGSNLPQNIYFLGANRRFQAKLAKSKNVYIIKTTESIPTKCCPVIKTTKCPTWVVPTHASQIHSRRYKYKIFKIQDGADRHPEKYLITISWQRFDRSARNLARLRKPSLRTGTALKISNFYKSKMADGRHLEKFNNGHISAGHISATV